MIPISESRYAARNETLFALRIHCLGCRRGPGNKGACIHEQVAVKQHRRICNDQGNMSTHPSAASTVNIASEEDHPDENTDVPNLSPFVSSQLRRILPCASDFRSLKELMDVVSANMTRAVPGCETEVYVAFDRHRVCPSCRHELVCSETDRHCTIRKRTVKLYTMIHGSFEISVVDFVCPRCSSLCYFDGGDAGLFSASKECVYSRELFDHILYHVTGLGCTFREAYVGAMGISQSVSATKVRLGSAPSCNRRATNLEFSQFSKHSAYRMRMVLSNLRARGFRWIYCA